MSTNDSSDNQRKEGGLEDMARLQAFSWEARDVEELKKQVQILRDAFKRSIQEIETLKELLFRTYISDQELYKSVRLEKMLGDYSAAGAAPWRHHSYFKYIVSETQYLREHLQMSDAEIAEFRETSEALMSQT